jgi:hypothetical protein
MGTLFLKLKEVQEALMAEAQAALEEVSPQIDANIEEFLQKQSSELRQSTGPGQKSG